MSPNIKVIFSDLFGVLLGPNYIKLINYIKSKTGEHNIKVYHKLFDEENMKFVRGELSFDDYFISLQYKLDKGSKLSKEKFKYYWNKMRIGPTSVVDDLLQLRSKYKIYILTNTTNNHIAKLKNKFTFIEQVDGIVTSDIAKSHKPNPAFFNFATSLAMVRSEEVLFIDDSIINVNVASKLGMTSYRYSTYKSFRNFIIEL